MSQPPDVCQEMAVVVSDSVYSMCIPQHCAAVSSGWTGVDCLFSWEKWC